MSRTTTFAIIGAGLLLAGGLGTAADAAGRGGCDGRLTLAQADTRQTPMGPGMMGPGQGMGPGMMGPGQGMGPGMMGQGQGPGRGMMGQGGMMGMLDRDGDGALTREEFVEQPRRGPMSGTEVAEENRAARFDRLDRNGDGRLTPDELSPPGTAGGQ